MNCVIALFAAPHAPSTRRALRFAEAALAAGHGISRVFLYREAVHLASANLVNPQDEQDIARAWHALVLQHRLDGVVCIAAALRRGVLDQGEASRHERPAAHHAAGWTLCGLGQLHDAMQQADRLVCFGGD